MKTNQSLKSVANYAKMNNVSTTYIYKLANSGRIKFVEIDGVKFVDIAVYPTIKG